MSETEILRSICVIEQTLLLSDCSPSIHSLNDSSNHETIDQQERDHRLYILKMNPYLYRLFTDIERSRLHKHAVNVRSYLASKDLRPSSHKQILAYSEEWMEKSRFFLEENAVPSNCVAINTDVRLFDWSVREAIEKSTL